MEDRLFLDLMLEGNQVIQVQENSRVTFQDSKRVIRDNLILPVRDKYQVSPGNKQVIREFRANNQVIRASQACIQSHNQVFRAIQVFQAIRVSQVKSRAIREYQVYKQTIRQPQVDHLSIREYKTDICQLLADKTAIRESQAFNQATQEPQAHNPAIQEFQADSPAIQEFREHNLATQVFQEHNPAILEFRVSNQVTHTEFHQVANRHIQEGRATAEMSMCTVAPAKVPCASQRANKSTTPTPKSSLPSNKKTTKLWLARLRKVDSKEVQRNPKCQVPTQAQVPSTL